MDKRNPKMGKYRSYLILGGIPLPALPSSVSGADSPVHLYAYVTYIGLSMCYTLVNAIRGTERFLTRDTDEITKLTSVRMFWRT